MKSEKTELTDTMDKPNAGPLRSSNEKVEKTSGSDVLLPNLHNHAQMTRLQAALRQVPDRVCVTAPSGDRSQSYIHHRGPAGGRTESTQPTPKYQVPEKQASGGVRVEDSLTLVALEELKGWKPHTLENIDEECAPLDPSHTGTIHQSDLMYLFLRRQVPFKPPTLASLLNRFSCSTQPEQVLYEDLLQFVRSLLKNTDAQNTEADIWKASCESSCSSSLGSMWSDGAETYVDPGETETWLQRFQKMESALHVCDSQNTGYMEKEQVRRLIQNYSLIFDLGLSPLGINEVIRKTQVMGRVHLASVLLLLKDRRPSLGSYRRGERRQAGLGSHPSTGKR